MWVVISIKPLFFPDVKVHIGYLTKVFYSRIHEVRVGNSV